MNVASVQKQNVQKFVIGDLFIESMYQDSELVYISINVPLYI
jgi:hypothetical protein